MSEQYEINGALMTVKDVAVFLGVTERTVYRYLTDHNLPGLKVGGQWRFRGKSVEAWLDTAFKTNFDPHAAQR